MSKQEDQNIAAENFPDLNTAFYSSQPHDYFRHRLFNLLLVASKDLELRRLIDDGITFGLIEISRKENAPPRDEAEDKESAERFVALEAEMLLHHTAETLLRLYLCHKGPPYCPWLELARLRQPLAFKKQVERALVDKSFKDRREDIGVVFFGDTDRTTLDPIPSEKAWEESLREVDRLLTYFANTILSDAHLYNAAKHGLAVQPGAYMVRLEVPKTPIGRDGMALQYLQVKEGAWHRTVDWVDTEESIVYVLRATDLMEQLWSVARLRYLGQEVSALQLFNEGLEGAVRDARAKTRGEGPVVTSMSQKLLYYTTRPQDPPVE